MPRYRRKPVVVEAVKIVRPISIESGDNTVKGHSGDYLITEKDGEQYPYNAEQFEQEFEKINNLFNLKVIVVKSLRVLKRKAKSVLQG